MGDLEGVRMNFALDFGTKALAFVLLLASAFFVGFVFIFILWMVGRMLT